MRLWTIFAGSRIGVEETDPPKQFNEMLSDIRSSDESGDDLASSTETERFTRYNLPRSLSEEGNPTRSDELQRNGPLTRQNTIPANLKRIDSGIY